jgi:hypothetical protein
MFDAFECHAPELFLEELQEATEYALEYSDEITLGEYGL